MGVVRLTVLGDRVWLLGFRSLAKGCFLDLFLDFSPLLLESTVLEETVFYSGWGGRFGAGMVLFANVLLVFKEVLGLGEVSCTTIRRLFVWSFFVEVGEFLVRDLALF
jgi:hypothetical protein